MFLKWFIPCLTAFAAVAVLTISLTWKKNRFTTKDLALAAVCVGSSTALSFWRVWKMPYGGSITIASMLPIMLFAYIAGFRKGLIAGLAYAGLQLVQADANEFVNPAQVFLDFFLGFGAVSLAGVFKGVAALEKCDFLLGITVAGIVRYFFSLISGVVFFYMYAPEGMGIWVYSAAYNSVLLIDAAICLAVAVFMQYSPHFRKFMNYMDDGHNFKRRNKKEEIKKEAVIYDEQSRDCGVDS